MSPEQIEVERKAFAEWWNDCTNRIVHPPNQLEAWLARAEKAQRVRSHLQLAVEILSRIPAINGTAQVEAMRAALKD